MNPRNESNPASPGGLTLPPELAPFGGRGPAHRKGLKLLVSGPPKTGKSFFAAHAPRPLVAFDCGEAGIQPYLQPDDVWLEVTGPATAKAAIDWVMQHEDEIATLVIDPVTTLWSDWMDYWAAKLESEGKLNADGQIHVGSWRKIKGPWKRNIFFPLQRAPFHVILTAWPKELEISEGDAPPGIRGGLQIKKVAEAQVEKTLRYLYDLWLQTGVELDELNRPTSRHWIRLAGGRRPITVPPSEFYTGRVWRFDARKPENPWEKVVGPWLDAWQKSPAAVEHLGPRDPEEAAAAMAEMVAEEIEAEVGRFITALEEAETLSKLRDVWSNIVSEWAGLDARHKAALERAKDRRKAELQKAEQAGRK